MTEEIVDQVITSTVSVELLRDLISALERICSASCLDDYLVRAGISPDLARRRHARITHEQLVRLYQIAAVETGDEMMGLWSRPIRAGALKVLCHSVHNATTVASAMYRFAQVWNLMLDDYRLELDTDDACFSISLIPRQSCRVNDAADGGLPVNRFGHMLMLKLAHGVVSLLVGYEVPLYRVSFAFPRPDFAEDYRVLFPARVDYDARYSTVCFHAGLAKQRFKRPYADLRPFLERAPRDWIFT